MIEEKTNLNLDLLERVLSQMEESQGWNASRAWALLLLGTAKINVLNVEQEEVITLINFLVNAEGGHFKDYYQTWYDIIAHAKTGDL